jgi:hypothetical protein
MRKTLISTTLSNEAIEPVKEIMEHTGLNFSAAQELLNRFIGENFLTASVVVYFNNGYEIIDGRKNREG